MFQFSNKILFKPRLSSAKGDCEGGFRWWWCVRGGGGVEGDNERKEVTFSV